MYKTIVVEVILSFELSITICTNAITDTVNSCGHPVLTDTPIIQIVAKCQTKINYSCLTEINSRYYGLSLMRTLTEGPSGVRYKES